MEHLRTRGTPEWQCGWRYYHEGKKLSDELTEDVGGLCRVRLLWACAPHYPFRCPLLFSLELAHRLVLGVEPLATPTLKGRGCESEDVAGGVSMDAHLHPRPPQAQDLAR